MTRQELEQILARNPAVTANDDPPRVAGVQSSVNKPDKGGPLVRRLRRTRESVARIIIRITDRRIRPLDPDRFAGGVHTLLDGLRHSKLIPEDNPFAIKLELESEEVSRRKEEGTFIDIIYP